MEVKIGVQYSARELVVESTESADEVHAAVTEALEKGSGTLTLTDEKGRRVVVPADKISYVEIAEQQNRQVGFGSA